MSELKPCPFCGGEASVKVLEYDEDCKVWGVFCESDLQSEYSHGHFVDNCATEAEAIAAWNSRADEAWPIAEITTDHIDLEHGRVTQRWIPERTCKMDKFGNCTSCGEFIAKSWDYVKRLSGGYDIKATRAYNYCPNCGAKVVGE